jgi:hypothetical protein
VKLSLDPRVPPPSTVNADPLFVPANPSIPSEAERDSAFKTLAADPYRNPDVCCYHFLSTCSFDIRVQGPSSENYTHFICDVICTSNRSTEPPLHFRMSLYSAFNQASPSPGPAQSLSQRLARSYPDSYPPSFDIQLISFHTPRLTPYDSLRSWYFLIDVQVNELIVTFPISSIINPVVHLSNLCHSRLAHDSEMTATRIVDKGCKGLVRPS